MFAIRFGALFTLVAGMLLGGCATSNQQPLMMKNYLEPVARVEGETATADQVYQSGRSALLSGDLVAAGRLFSHTLVLEPDYLDAINGLAAILTIQGRYTESLALMRQAAERAPDNGMFRRNVARVEALSRRAQSTESHQLVQPRAAAPESAAPQSAVPDFAASESGQVPTSSNSAAILGLQHRPVEPTPASITTVGSNVYQLAPARMRVVLTDAAPPPLAVAEARVFVASTPRDAAASSDSAIPSAAGVPSSANVPAAGAAHRPRARATPAPSADESYSSPVIKRESASNRVPTVSAAPFVAVPAPVRFEQVAYRSQVDTPLVSPLPPPRLMVSNGMGREGWAAENARSLRALGMPASRITNFGSFDVERTMIVFRAGQLANAERIRSSLPAVSSARLVESESLPAGIDVRLVLGKDSSQS